MSCVGEGMGIGVLVVRDEDVDRVEDEYGLYSLRMAFRDNAAILNRLYCDIHKETEEQKV